MTEGEFESLKAIHAVAPNFAPEPFAWGKYRKEEPETYFLLVEFREVGEQPPDPIKFTARLADLHKMSVSPTGKFGFHITTCHADGANLDPEDSNPAPHMEGILCNDAWIPVDAAFQEN